MAKSISLKGIRIQLRDWKARDLQILTYWLQPGHSWQEFDGPYYPHPDAQEITDILELLEMRIQFDNWETPRTRLAIVDNGDGDLLGQVTWYWQSRETNWLSVGIVIYDPDNWDRGIGFEALGLWSDYLFSAMPTIVRLDLRTWSGNMGMIRLAEKLGFQLEARFRRARIVNGRFYDGLGFGILRLEWDEHYPDGFSAHLSRYHEDEQ